MRRGPRISGIFALLLLLRAGTSAAAPPLGVDVPRPPPGMRVDVSPTIAPSAEVLFDGWNDLLFGLENGTSEVLRGRVVVRSRAGYSETSEYAATAPYELGPGSKATLQLPVLAKTYSELDALVFLADRDEPVFTRHYTVQSAPHAVLLDARDGSGLRARLDDVPIEPLSSVPTSPGSTTSSSLLLVAPARVDPATGDVVLPTRAATYSRTSVVLLSTNTLGRLSADELDAFGSWILGGGTAALVVTRPEDLASPTLTTLLGGAARPTPVPRSVYRELVLSTMVGGAGGPRFAAAPSDELAPTLLGYEGGNLTPSLYGSSAYYGLGEVHLLPFDPARRPALDDPWAQARVVDLARRALDRQHTVVLTSDASSYQANDIRRQLDPNESSRWAIGAAALLLCVYAALAGPVNFARAARSGQPLRALAWLPVLALGAFLLVVGVGTVAKGTSGRARHLTLVQAGAGVGTGRAERFRGFYSADAEKLTLPATDARCVLSMGVSTGLNEVTTEVAVRKDGLRILGGATMPWQTLVVSEQGFAELGRGVAMARDADGALTIVNRTGRSLRSVIVRLPSGTPRYFPRIADGERRRVDEGRALDASESERGFSAGVAETYPSHPTTQGLPAYSMEPFLRDDTPGLAQAWAAIAQVGGNEADWFPSDVPVLLAQLEGGEGAREDAGFPIEADRVLLRIVGYGGEP